MRLTARLIQRHAFPVYRRHSHDNFTYHCHASRRRRFIGRDKVSMNIAGHHFRHALPPSPCFDFITPSFPSRFFILLSIYRRRAISPASSEPHDCLAGGASIWDRDKAAYAPLPSTISGFFHRPSLPLYSTITGLGADGTMAKAVFTIFLFGRIDLFSLTFSAIFALLYRDATFIYFHSGVSRGDWPIRCVGFMPYKRHSALNALRIENACSARAPSPPHFTRLLASRS